LKIPDPALFAASERVGHVPPFQHQYSLRFPQFVPLCRQPDASGSVACQRQFEEEIMSIRPLYDRVVVKPSEAESTSKGGIVLPGKAAEKPCQGEVVAIGSGTVLKDGNLRPLAVKVGDRVLYGKYAGTELTVDGEDLLVMNESDILAVLEGQVVSEKEEKAA